MVWLADGTELIVQRATRWASGDAGITTCEGTGLYAVARSGQWRLWGEGPDICAVLSQAMPAALSPNGQRLVYIDKFANRAILALELPSMRRSSVLDGCAGMTPPAWSSSSTEIAIIATCGEFKDTSLYVLQYDGLAVSRDPVPISGLTVDEPVAWSPDGQALAYVRPAKDETEIVIMTPAGMRERVLARQGRAPSWSPTGDRLAYIGESAATTIRSVRSVRPDGTGDKEVFASPIARAPGRISGPLVWSPNGKRIGFAIVYADSSVIWTVGLEGEDPLRIAGPP